MFTESFQHERNDEWREQTPKRRYFLENRRDYVRFKEFKNKKTTLKKRKKKFETQKICLTQISNK